MKSRFRRSKAERGFAIVEFTVTLPLLLLLLLAIAEFGRMLFHYSNLIQASRDAGRFVASHAWNRTLGRIELDSALLSQARNVAAYGVPSNQYGSPIVPGLSPSNVGIFQEGVDHVRVSINYVFQPALSNSLPTFFGNPIPLNIPLTTSVVMRAL